MLEEKAIPLKMLWATAAGFSDRETRTLSDRLLFDMPHIGSPTAIILGSTHATAFCVAEAVRAGHTYFIVLGNKKVTQEHSRFTDYVIPKIMEKGMPLPSSDRKTEKAYGASLLKNHFGISKEKITIFESDFSTNIGQNMQVLGRILENSSPRRDMAFDVYTLAGTALRVLMTARHELSQLVKAVAVHNVYPTGITRDSWAEDSAARAHMASEAAKILGDDPLYVRLGYCSPVNLRQEITLCQQANRRNTRLLHNDFC